MKFANEVLFAQVSPLFPPFPVLGHANYLPSQPRLVDLSDGLTGVQCSTQAHAGTLGTEGPGAGGGEGGQTALQRKGAGMDANSGKVLHTLFASFHVSF